MNDEPTLARVCMLLVTIISELRLLRSETGRKASSSKPRALSADDARMLGALLPVVVAVTGGESLTVRHLTDAAQGRTAEAKSLRRALDATRLNSLALGRLFRRAMDAETPTAGLYVHRIGPSRDGVMFCVDAKTHEHHIAAGVAGALRDTFQS